MNFVTNAFVHKVVLCCLAAVLPRDHEDARCLCAVMQQLAEQQENGRLRSSLLPLIVLLMSAPSRLLHILLYSSQMRCGGSFSAETSAAEKIIRLPIAAREAFTRQHGVGLHSCVCVAATAAILRANIRKRGHGSVGNASQSVALIAGVGLLLLALVLGVVSSVRALSSVVKYSASILAIVAGAFCCLARWLISCLSELLRTCA